MLIKINKYRKLVRISIRSLAGEKIMAGYKFAQLNQ